MGESFDPVPSMLGNHLLDALPAEKRESMASRLKPVEFRPHDVLYEPGRRIGKVYFPQSGVISLMAPLLNGEAIETATIGNEGMLGVSVFLGGGTNGAGIAMAQVAGRGLYMSADTFRAEIAGDGKLRELLLGYTQALFAQISQSVACNGTHSIRERCARWLLETHDRAGSDQFVLTQEFLADMLAVRRPSVTVAAGMLQRAGLIEYRRGQITILDRTGLETSSCECYQAILDAYNTLVPIP